MVSRPIAYEAVKIAQGDENGALSDASATVGVAERKPLVPINFRAGAVEDIRGDQGSMPYEEFASRYLSVAEPPEAMHDLAASTQRLSQAISAERKAQGDFLRSQVQMLTYELANATESRAASFRGVLQVSPVA